MFKLFRADKTYALSPGTIVFTVFFLLGLYFLFYIRGILVTLFLAVILMSALNPAVRFFERRAHIPRIASILLLYLVIMVLLGLSVALIVPILTRELPTLIATLNLPTIPQEIWQLKFSLSQLQNVMDQIGSSARTVFAVISSTFNGIFGFFTILVMTGYLLLEREDLYKKVSWVSKEKRHLEMARRFIDEIEVQLGGWVRGQVMLMVIIGVLTFIGLSLLSVPYALPLAILAGLLEILPNLGPTVAAIPGILIAYVTLGPAMAGFTALFYIVVQQLENNLIVPRVMRDHVDVNPLATILLILIGFRLAGVMGALLAVPSYIVLRSIYSLWLQESKRE